MKYKVMLVDDHKLFRKGLRMLIDALNRFEVGGEASNGIEFLSLLDQSKPDVVMLDIAMPEMDGLTFTVTVRQQPNYANVPIMMITTEGGKKDIVEALTRGVTTYVIKPFTPDILKAKMEELIAKCQ